MSVLNERVLHHLHHAQSRLEGGKGEKNEDDGSSALKGDMLVGGNGSVDHP